MFCALCGSYNSQRVSSLLSTCKGKPAERTGKAQQLHRLRRGLHPSHEGRWVAIGLAEPFAPSDSQLLWFFGSWVDGAANLPPSAARSRRRRSGHRGRFFSVLWSGQRLLATARRHAAGSQKGHGQSLQAAASRRRGLPWSTCSTRSPQRRWL